MTPSDSTSTSPTKIIDSDVGFSGSMSSPIKRSASITRANRVSATPSLQAKRSSAYLSTPTTLEYGLASFGEGNVSASRGVDELGALRRISEGQNRQITSLRSRIADLEKHLEQGTSPELQRLSAELATLEDLFAQTQRDNETKHAEAERQKVYVKELENLLNTSLGPSWRDDHDIHPPASHSITVTASTPLPKPKPAQPLRHSVSFSNKRATPAAHRRASSAIDLNLMVLAAVKEDAELGAMDDTPTGAFRRLTSKQGEMLSKTEQTSDAAAPAIDEKELLCQSSKGSASQVNQGSLLVVDTAQLQKIVQLLSTLDVSALASLSKAATSPDRAATDELASARLQHIRTVKCMFEEQEQRLAERETRLRRLVALVSDGAFVFSRPAVYLFE